MGIGAGWLKEEFEAVGAPDFAAARQGDRRIHRGLQRAVDQGQARASPASMSSSTTSSSRRSRCRSRIRRSGSAARAGRRCAAPRGSATPGIRSAPTRHPLDSLPRFKAGIARLRKMTAEAGRDPKAVGLAFRCTALRREGAGQGGRRRAPAVLGQAGGDRRRHAGAARHGRRPASTSASAARPSRRCWARCSSSRKRCCRCFSAPSVAEGPPAETACRGWRRSLHSAPGRSRSARR